MCKIINVRLKEYKTRVLLYENDKISECIVNALITKPKEYIDYIHEQCTTTLVTEDGEEVVSDLNQIIDNNFYEHLVGITVKEKTFEEILSGEITNFISNFLGTSVTTTYNQDYITMQFNNYPLRNQEFGSLYIRYPAHTFEIKDHSVIMHPIRNNQIFYYQDAIGNPLNHPVINELGNPKLGTLRYSITDLISEIITTITFYDIDDYIYNQLPIREYRSEFIDKYEKINNYILSYLNWDPKTIGKFQLRNHINHYFNEYFIMLFSQKNEIAVYEAKENGFTHVGKLHQDMNKECEDYLVSMKTNDYQLSVLCDGAGGMKEGKEASRLIAIGIADYVEKYLEDFKYNDITTIKINLLIEINRLLDRKAKQLQCKKEDLATTLIVGYKDTEGNNIVVHLGDGIILEKKEGEDDLIEVSPPENGPSASTTYLTGMDALSPYLHFYRWTDPNVEYLLMMSDGSYDLITKLKQKYHYHLNCIDDISSIEEYLDNKGTEDDYSVVKVD